MRGAGYCRPARRKNADHRNVDRRDTRCLGPVAARMGGARRWCRLACPKFQDQGRGAFFLTAPLARLSARLILGRRRSFAPMNTLNAAYWTTEYPVSALLPMASPVAQARSLPFERYRSRCCSFSLRGSGGRCAADVCCRHALGRPCYRP